MTDDLNPEEEQLLDQFRTRPTQGSIKVTNIWVLQWLPAEERQTGEELADWANQRRRGWTAFFRCNSKRDVIGAIDSAADHARSMDCSPILHIEAHGDENGISSCIKLAADLFVEQYQ